MGRLRLFVPLVAFALLAVLLFRGLSLDPTALPSALLDKPFPAFTLPTLRSDTPRSRDDIIKGPALVNVWATWCYSCRVEHPFLVELAEWGIPIVGLNYKDEPTKARQWLIDLGNPYSDNISDTEGVLGLDLGVYGAPETYVVDASGNVRYRHVGVLDSAVWEGELSRFFSQETAP